MSCEVINDPAVHAELSALYPVYEKALVENDVEMLTRMFWGSESAMRFGAGENLYGIEEIEAFRKARPAVGLARTLTGWILSPLGRTLGASRWSLREVRSVGGRARFG